mmetsp:Transcript_6471/g.19922  ORF Transcript_6471/g.19922 Transcript_6471/m.19922 type:complete len:220 (-) Transcript_6471:18-677(-)
MRFHNLRSTAATTSTPRASRPLPPRHPRRGAPRHGSRRATCDAWPPRRCPSPALPSPLPCLTKSLPPRHVLEERPPRLQCVGNCHCPPAQSRTAAPRKDKSAGQIDHPAASCCCGPWAPSRADSRRRNSWTGTIDKTCPLHASAHPPATSPLPPLALPSPFPCYCREQTRWESACQWQGAATRWSISDASVLAPVELEHGPRLTLASHSRTWRPRGGPG